jgi:N terminus of Rad21 / Rec8 like protein
MFYSQIVLSKKGPLGSCWLAAHHEKRLSRPQIFAFDISQTVHDIAHPVVPLALRLSGHLLLGVVRIYSRKVNYLVEDAHDASVKIDTAFTVAPIPHQPLKLLAGRGGSRNSGGAAGGAGGGPADRMDMAHFGDLHHHAAAFAAGGGFEIPTDLIPELEAWDEASTDEEGDEDDHHNMGNRENSPREGPSPRKRRRTDQSDALDDSLENVTRDTTTVDDESMLRRSSTAGAAGGGNNNNNMRSHLTTSAEMEDWGAFDPEDEDDEEDDESEMDGKRRSKDSIVPEIETTRAADVSGSPDQLVRRGVWSFRRLLI